jgi:hypothetical protein
VPDAATVTDVATRWFLQLGRLAVEDHLIFAERLSARSSGHPTKAAIHLPKIHSAIRYATSRSPRGNQLPGSAIRRDCMPILGNQHDQ